MLWAMLLDPNKWLINDWLYPSSVIFRSSLSALFKRAEVGQCLPNYQVSFATCTAQLIAPVGLWAQTWRPQRYRHWRTFFTSRRALCNLWRTNYFRSTGRLHTRTTTHSPWPIHYINNVFILPSSLLFLISCYIFVRILCTIYSCLMSASQRDNAPCSFHSVLNSNTDFLAVRDVLTYTDRPASEQG